MIKKEFLKSSLIYTISSALSTVASFLLLPFYTSTKLLSVSDFGALSLYIGLSVLVQAIASFSLEFYVGVVYHELKNNPEELKSKISSLNGYLITLGLLIITGFAILGNSFIHDYVDNAKPESFRYLMMSVLTGIFNAHFKFYCNLLIHREKPLRYFWANILNFVSTVLLSVTILELFPNSLEGPLWGRLLSCFLIFTLSFGEITWLYGISFKRKFFSSAWHFCFPLMITAVFQWILGYSDRYIIKPLLHNKDVAIFDLAVKFTLLVSFLLDGLSSAISPRVFSLLRENKGSVSQPELHKYYSGFNVVAVLLVPLNILILPIILPMFLNDEKYLQAFLFFGIACAGLVTRGIQNLFIFPVHVYRKTSRLIAINGFSALLQVILAYILILKFKLYGAAIALNIVKVMMIGLYAIFCKDLISQELNWAKLIWLPVVVLIGVSISELFITAYGVQMHLVHATEFILILILTYLVYKNEWLALRTWFVKLLKSS